MKDCRECRHSRKSHFSFLCMAMEIPKPTEYMRDDRSECGLKADLWEPKDRKYAEYDDEQP